MGGYKSKNVDQDTRIGIWMIKDNKNDKFFTRYDFGNGDKEIKTPKEMNDEEV